MKSWSYLFSNMPRTKLFGAIFILFLNLFNSTPVAMAKEKTSLPKVTARLAPDAISPEDPAYLTIEITSNDGLRIPMKNPELQTIDGLEAVGVNNSTQMSFTNGKMSGFYLYKFTLIPHKEGVFTIPPLKILFPEGSVDTNPVELKVKKGTPWKEPEKDKSLFPVGPSRLTTNVYINAPLLPKKTAWIDVCPQKTNSYVGEVVPVTFKIYSQATIVDHSSPAFVDKKLSNHKFANLYSGVTNLNEQNYYVDCFETKITLNEPGEVSTDGKINVRVSEKADNKTKNARALNGAFSDPFFDSFFTETEKTYSLANSPKHSIHVQALPPADPSASGSTAIGHYEMEVVSDTPEVKLGEPIIIKTTIKGSGNFDSVTNITIPQNDTYRYYPLNVSFKATDGFGFAGTKTFTGTIIPNGDKFELPSIHFSYFDTESARYHTLTIPPDQIPVKIIRPEKTTIQKLKESIFGK